MDNVLEVENRAAFRAWLSKNAGTEKECWVVVKRGRPVNGGVFYYLDAVEEALCFGWIDSTTKKVGDRTYQRFSPRKKDGLWSELNKERARRLVKLGLMTERGEKTLPPLEDPFLFDPDVEDALKKEGVFDTFRSFPPLYQRVRVYNVAFYKGRNAAFYDRALAHLVEETKRGRLFGEWNDYGRLLDY